MTTTCLKCFATFTSLKAYDTHRPSCPGGRIAALKAQLDDLLKFQNRVVEAFGVPEDGSVTDGATLIDWFVARAAELVALKTRLADAEAALREAWRFMDYFAEGRTSFVGPGTPKSCLARIDAYFAKYADREGRGAS